jgi:hypothetical protein
MIEILLRLEGVVIFLICLWFYQRMGAPWLQFGLLWFLPDISMVGYFWGKKVGAIVYNIVHTYSFTFMLMVWGWFLKSELILGIGVIFTSHIALDRFLGFGLKHFTGFKDTSLGRL